MAISKVLTVAVATPTYTASPDINYNVDPIFKVRNLAITTQLTGGATAITAVSFDGVNDNIFLAEGGRGAALYIPGAQKIWFRNVASTATVAVYATA
jgi:hypothetical protein